MTTACHYILVTKTPDYRNQTVTTGPATRRSTLKVVVLLSNVVGTVEVNLHAALWIALTYIPVGPDSCIAGLRQSRRGEREARINVSG